MSGGDEHDWRKGVRPLAGGDRPPPEPPAPRARSPRAEFVREADGSGRRADVAAAQLARLRRGEWKVEREIDLHGLARDAARQAVRAGLGEAAGGGERCVRVIHGRGLHSQQGAVLRDALPDWLVDAPQADHLLAWARERDSHGGATLVLLRRLRAP